MRRTLFVCSLVVLIGIAHSFCSAQSAGGEIYQVSSFDTFKKGVYDGDVEFRELKKYGDFGIGTVNGLDGEMVALDGKFYQVKSDGKPYPIADSTKTPFATVTFFRADKKKSLEQPLDLKGLQGELDRLVSNPDLPSVFKIVGSFDQVKARSVPCQQKPYVGLMDALKNQVFFDLKNVPGTLVGFRYPGYMDGVNVGGYHFHFIAADGKSGGHVLDCLGHNLTVELMSAPRLSIRLLSTDAQ